MDFDHGQVVVDLGHAGLVFQGFVELEGVVAAVAGAVQVLATGVQAGAREQQPGVELALFGVLGGPGGGLEVHFLGHLDVAAVDHAIEQIHP